MSKHKPNTYKKIAPKEKRVSKLLAIDVTSNCWENDAAKSPPDAKHDIIEIGVVPIDLDTLVMGEAASFLVKPKTAKVSAFCTNITSITQEMVEKDGLSFKTAIKKLTHDFNSKETVWLSWSEFDRYIIRNRCNERKVQYPFATRHYNLKSLITIIMGLEKAPRLPEAMELMGLQYEGHHYRAKDDAANMARLAVEMFGRMRMNKDGTLVATKPKGLFEGISWKGLAAALAGAEASSRASN
jgi:inhibitor of KinA sporulation pathway (predicted exonuclease)